MCTTDTMLHILTEINCSWSLKIGSLSSSILAGDKLSEKCFLSNDLSILQTCKIILVVCSIREF